MQANRPHAVLRETAAIQRRSAHRPSAEGADDSALRERVAAAKRANKVAFSRLVGDRMGLRLDPNALFDVRSSASTNTAAVCRIPETVAIARSVMTHARFGSRA